MQPISFYLKIASSVITIAVGFVVLYLVEPIEAELPYIFARLVLYSIIYLALVFCGIGMIEETCSEKSKLAAIT